MLAALGCGSSFLLRKSADHDNSDSTVENGHESSTRRISNINITRNSSHLNNQEEQPDMLGSGINASKSSVGPVAGKRPKVSLMPGRSLMDWIRLGASGQDLQGFGGKLKTVSMEELALHNKENDCWMLLKGNVYNITAYTEYHPGGVPELMQAAGKDGTKYFDEVHKWVNVESMLAKCLIGPVEKPAHKKEISNSLLPLLVGPPPVSLKQDGIKDAGNISPRYEWYQRDECIIISIYTKRKHITADSVVVDCHDGKNFNCKVLLEEKYYQIQIELENEISTLQAYGPTNASGKLEVKLVKAINGLQWKSLGKKLGDNDKMFNEGERELVYRSCKVFGIDNVTPNTKLFTIELPDRVFYRTPIGHHVLLEGSVQGMKISRNYTVVLEKLGETEDKNQSSNSRLHLMIKIYKDGTFTPLLNELQIGDLISVSDCTGNFKLTRLKKAKSVYMIAAGTGLTPMLRIIDFILKDSETKRKASLLFANRHESDILWRNELEKLMENHSEIFNIAHILSRPPEGWNGLSGRINKNILANYLSNAEKPDIEEELLVCVCGSTEFNQLVKRFLLEMEYTETMIHCFQG